jgi:hypothetical protein
MAKLRRASSKRDHLSRPSSISSLETLAPFTLTLGDVTAGLGLDNCGGLELVLELVFDYGKSH